MLLIYSKLNKGELKGTIEHNMALSDIQKIEHRSKKYILGLANNKQ